MDQPPTPSLIGRYFDNAATTAVDPRVLEAMLPYLREAFGNANSIHTWGMRAMDGVERARAHVAELIGADDPSQIVFTSGATEANNWVVSAHPDIAISPFEHSAMREPALAAGALVLANDGSELFSPPRQCQLISVMAVNNETGSRWNVKNYEGSAQLTHSDITQAVGKVAVDVSGIDYASLSGHKFYGPKGVGALYYREQPPAPFILGGEQENGLRGGTLNVPAIVGMGEAARICIEEQEADLTRAQEHQSILLDTLARCPDMRVNGGSDRSPYIVSLSFLGVEGETLVIETDRAGYAISSGAACSSRSTEPSHVLTALGLEEKWLRGTIRVSFGRFNDADSVDGLAKHLLLTLEKLRKMH
jgi:cysteine desulfurase